MKTAKTVIWTVIVLVVLGALGGFFFVESGVYDVAATSPPSGVERFLAGAVRRRSIAVRDAGVTPPNLDDPALIRLGYSRYDDMCAVCHSAPGLEETPIEKGLNPRPPHLWSHGTQRMSDQRMYWIVEHGIRMTGMPAFGPTSDARDIWSLVAVIRQLPKLQPGQFEREVAAAEQAEGGEAGEENEAPDGAHPRPGMPVPTPPQH